MSSRDRIVEKLKTCSVSVGVQRQFERLYDQYVAGETGYLDWDDIQPMPQERLQHVTSWTQEDPALLDKVAILKLNGGLGTSMGCTGPKCLISLSDEATFLDVSVAQVTSQRERFQKEIPFILMNSFKTEAKTKEALPPLTGVHHFNQNQFPRVLADTYEPFSHEQDSEQEWAPPGHGDLYVALSESGLLSQLIEQGIEYLFVSNIDNLGPQLDLRILTHMAQKNLSFMMEVIPKTLSDVKGGTPVLYKNRLALLERAQVPQSHLSSFEDLSTFPVFNTNNLWLHLPSIQKALMDNTLNLPLIVNRKTLYNTDLVQFETAMGAALGCFDRSEVVVVNRDRFLPVKTTKDLLVVQSDVITKDWETGEFSFAEGCDRYPSVELHPSFSTMSGYIDRVKSVPSLINRTEFQHNVDEPIS